MTNEKISGYFTDDGTEINQNLIVKPSLCVSCVKDDDESERKLCNLTRAGQEDEDEFECFAFVPRKY